MNTPNVGDQYIYTNDPTCPVVVLDVLPFHVGPDTWTRCVFYAHNESPEQRFVRSTEDFLAAFTPTSPSRPVGVVTHVLKLSHVYYDDVSTGRKAFELRSCKDRSFDVGDFVLFQEYRDGHRTGREVLKTITYVLSADAVYNLTELAGYCIFQTSDPTTSTRQP